MINRVFISRNEEEEGVWGLSILYLYRLSD